jgi:hypothetical protein
VGGIVAGEGYENHINNGKNGKSENTAERKSQKGLVELIVKERLHIVLAALYLLTLRCNIHTDAALLYLQSPGVDKCENKYNSQKSVKKDLYRVVARNPDVGIVYDVILESALHGTDSGSRLEPVTLCQPIQTAAGNEHISEEYYLKQQEKDTAKYLSVIEISKSEDKEGGLDRPVTLSEGTTDITKLILYPKSAVFEKLCDLNANSLKPKRDSREEKLDIVPQGLEFIKF